MSIWNQITTIDTVHSMVHRGKFFSGGYYNSALADNGTLDILIQGASVHNTHTRIDFTGSAEFNVSIYEDTVVSNVGTTVSMTNHNRSSSNIFSGTVTHTPTITNTGSAINGSVYVSGGNGGNATGGNTDGFGTEIILEKTKNYLFRATNISGQAIKISAHLNSYQPTL